VRSRPRKVTVDQIRAALLACEGKVAQAAKRLGVARNNLYKRLANSGISPDEFRGGAGRSDSATPSATSAPATEAAPSTGGHAGATATAPVPVSRLAIFPAPSDPRSLRRVEGAPSTADDMRALRLSRTFYLRPDQVKALNDACLDLPGVLREKLSPSKVLEKFIDDCFADWLRSKLGKGKR
jgi:hypothetical protein